MDTNVERHGQKDEGVKSRGRSDRNDRNAWICIDAHGDRHPLNPRSLLHHERSCNPWMSMNVHGY